jgi:hypothetical protein
MSVASVKIQDATSSSSANDAHGTLLGNLIASELVKEVGKEAVIFTDMYRKQRE